MSESEGRSSSATPVPSPSRASQPGAGRRGLLQGGYLAVLILALLGAAVGAVWGWSTEPPVYRSTGLVHIEPSMPNHGDPGGGYICDAFRGFVRFQVQVLESRRAASIAMGQAIWREAVGGLEPVSLDEFLSRRQVVPAPGTQQLQVLFSHPLPAVARAGVEALMDTYQQLWEEVAGPADRESLEQAMEEVDKLSARIKTDGEEILTLTADFGGVDGLAIRHEAMVKQAGDTEAELEEIRQIGETQRRVEALQAGIEDRKARFERIRAVAGELEAQMAGTGRITILDRGTRPASPFQDPRRANAAKGALLGAGIGALLAVLLGPLGHRRRAPQEVGDPSTPVGD